MKPIMLPNNNDNPLIRLSDLLNAIKQVYASTFYQCAKDYIKVTSYRSGRRKNGGYNSKNGWSSS